MLELVAAMAIFSVVMLMVGSANSLLIRSQRDIKDAREGADDFEYIMREVIDNVKGSKGAVSVDRDTLRFYKEDGTYETLGMRGSFLYFNEERICKVSNWSVTQTSDMIVVTAECKGAAPLYLTLYRPPLDGGGTT